MAEERGRTRCCEPLLSTITKLLLLYTTHHCYTPLLYTTNTPLTHHQHTTAIHHCYTPPQEFVTCGDDKTVRRWDSAHQRCVKTVLLDAKARAIAYAPDAAHIGKRHPSPVTHVSPASHNPFIVFFALCFVAVFLCAAIGLYSGRVEIYDSDLNEKVKGISVCREWIQDLKYSPDTKHLAVSSHGK